MSKSFAVIISTPPYSTQTQTAMNFIQAALTLGHSITGIFLYQSGVLNAAEAITMPSDELDMRDSFAALSKEGIPIYLCVTAAEKRGAAQIDNENVDGIREGFIVAGLTEMVPLSNNADKLVQF